MFQFFVCWLTVSWNLVSSVPVILYKYWIDKWDPVTNCSPWGCCHKVSPHLVRSLWFSQVWLGVWWRKIQVNPGPQNIILVVEIFFRSAGCPESRCFLTSDRKYLGSVSEFDAIIFHQRKIRLKDIPAKRGPEQRYVQWMFESPAHSNYDFTPAAKLAGFFNWSMSYRLDSTFPRPYGMFKKVWFNKVLFIWWIT